MKKGICYFMFFFFIFFSCAKNIFANEQKRFVVTAYYSPLPDQKYYMRGDFEKEKILQGNGTHGASGKAVFSGMLAGPNNYSFGTKVYLEGLGVGVIEDRGQAIVKKGERGYQYDRIDVWMGYGDEGLKRALAWGKRTVKGEILDNNSQTTIDYKNLIAPDWAVANLKPYIKEKTVFDLYLGKGSDIDEVKKLQEFFKELGIYDGEIDGIYNSKIISIVYNFQIKNGILDKEEDVGAGYWGEQTKKKFKEKYLLGFFDNKRDLSLSSDLENNEEIKENYKELDENILKEDIFSKFENTTENIRNIEMIFKEIGIYNGEITGDIKNLSKIVLNFQLKENIILSEKDIGAGYFGPKTRASLKNKYEIFQDKKIELERKKVEIKEKLELIEKESKNISGEKIKNISSVLKKGDISQEVRELQNLLAELGYFSEKSTAIFGEKTFEALANFQLEKGLIDSLENPYTGILGVKTLAELQNSLTELYKKDKLAKENISKEDLSLI